MKKTYTEKEMLILMMDRCTKQEAIRYLTGHNGIGATIYELNDWMKQMEAEEYYTEEK